MTFEPSVKGILLAILFSTMIAFLFDAPSDEALAFETHEVEILKGSTTLADKSYSPNPLQVMKGDSITFVNRDSVLHTATSGNGSPPTPSGAFDSGYLAPNRVATITINEAGEFPYYCQAHPTMTGLVRASEGSVGDTEFSVTAIHDGQSYEIAGRSPSAKASLVTINPSVSVVVTFDGSGAVELTLPTSMIEGISSVATNNGTSISFTKTNETDSATTISFTVPQGDGSVVIMGARVVPEFSSMAALIVAGSTGVASLVVARVSKKGSRHRLL